MTRPFLSKALIIAFIVVTAPAITNGLLPAEVRVGGLFERGEENLELAFHHAIEKINGDARLLPKTKLIAEVERLDKSDSFAASRRACSALQKGIVTLFGPQTGKSSNYVRSVCSSMQMPHFETRWDSTLSAEPMRPYSINLSPHPSALGRALRDLVIKKNWKTFAVIYVEDSSMILIQEILKHSKMHTKRIIVRKARETIDSKPSFKEILKELARLNVKNIIIDVPRDQVSTVLAHAQDVNMLKVYNSYIFTTLDIHTVNLRQFYQTGTNISAFSIIDQTYAGFDNIIRDWHTENSGQLRLLDQDIVKDLHFNFTTEVALTYDAMLLLARSLHDLNRTQTSSMANGSPIQVNSLNCARISDTWQFGNMLRMYMQLKSIQGITGELKLDERGYRTDFKLKLYDLTREGLKSVAQWTMGGGLDYMGNYSSVLTENYRELLRNKTLTVVTLENRPYVMRVPDSENKTGVARWEGYCVDLIHELAKLRNFKFDLRVLSGEQGFSHGNRNDKGEWNGLIRELIDGKADIAVADLTITYERESVVDFTMPFMSLGIGILVKKPTKASPKLFEFMLPLAPEVWIYLLTAFVGVTLFMFMVARFSPYEWANPHPCEHQVDELCNEFTMKNTLWFTIGCLMQQGCDIMPRALSTRVMAGAWWFFILIIVSSYTANLAAFLTVERMDNPIQSADDLAKQTKVLYGCLKSGSTRAFFQRSNYTTYARMWSFMESKRAETLLDSNNKGVERVRKGDFAFLMESTTIEYTVERNCDLAQVGSLLDQKGYGIATQQDSPYRAVLSEAIVALQEAGVLHRLKDRWWKEKKEGNTSCEVKETQKSSGQASELGLDHVGGVFVVLGLGALISLAICVGEFVWKTKKIPRSERNHVLVELFSEFKYVFCAKGNQRPFRRDFSLDDDYSGAGNSSSANGGGGGATAGITTINGPTNNDGKLSGANNRRQRVNYAADSGVGTNNDAGSEVELLASYERMQQLQRQLHHEQQQHQLQLAHQNGTLDGPWTLNGSNFGMQNRGQSLSNLGHTFTQSISLDDAYFDEPIGRRPTLRTARSNQMSSIAYEDAHDSGTGDVGLTRRFYEPSSIIGGAHNRASGSQQLPH